MCVLYVLFCSAGDAGEKGDKGDKGEDGVGIKGSPGAPGAPGKATFLSQLEHIAAERKQERVFKMSTYLFINSGTAHLIPPSLCVRRYKL